MWTRCENGALGPVGFFSLKEKKFLDSSILFRASLYRAISSSIPCGFDVFRQNYPRPAAFFWVLQDLTQKMAFNAEILDIKQNYTLHTSQHLHTADSFAH